MGSNPMPSAHAAKPRRRGARIREEPTTGRRRPARRAAISVPGRAVTDPRPSARRRQATPRGARNREEPDTARDPSGAQRRRHLSRSHQRRVPRPRPLHPRRAAPSIEARGQWMRATGIDRDPRHNGTPARAIVSQNASWGARSYSRWRRDEVMPSAAHRAVPEEGRRVCARGRVGLSAGGSRSR